MNVEIVFGGMLDEIRKNKYENIQINMASLTSKYDELREILMECGFIKHVILNDDIGNSPFVNKIMQGLTLPNGKLCISPEKIILTGDIENVSSPVFEQIENIQLNDRQVRNIYEIKKKFPNLKNILREIRFEKIELKDKEDLKKAFEYLEYCKCIKSDRKIGIKYTDIRRYIEENENLKNRFMIDRDNAIINLDRLDEDGIEEEFFLFPSDLEELILNHKEKLIKSKDKFQLGIENVSELPLQKVKELQNYGIKSKVKVFGGYEEVYDLDVFCAIQEKLNELVEGIDVNLPEKEKFAEVYKRICKSIIYDTPAAYPRTPEEEKYKNEQKDNCRSLKNGLLEGKCVCAGYAEILRNALSLVGIESKYIKGNVCEKRISKDKFDPSKVPDKFYYKEDKETGEIILYESHAWNKVKLDGKWYNVDATWDANNIREGKVPTKCLKTDEEIMKYDKKIDFDEPVCETIISKKEVDQLFDGHHIFIGNVKIPNFKDIKDVSLEVIEAYKEIGRDILNIGKNSKKAIKQLLTGKEHKMLESHSDVKIEESSYSAWDLRNWNTSKKDFTQKVNKEVSKFNENKVKNIIKERKEDDNIK